MAEQGSKTASRWRKFRWLYVARLVVASVVSVVAVAVIVRAVVVMLRPEKLQLQLGGGLVAFDNILSLPPPNNTVTLTFVLRANNPSGRASVEYGNVAVRLTEAVAAAASSSSSSPATAATIAAFDLTENIPVLQQTAHEVIVTVGLTPKQDLPMRYVRALYEGRAVAGAQMGLTGVLTTHVAMKSTSVRTTYYCWPVSIAIGKVDPAATNGDVACFDEKDAPAHM
uniref:Uncharacterized protein n=1 Tax=Avena sativa TaxID=4498 RepID=A0ACD6A9S0_AVESA